MTSPVKIKAEIAESIQQKLAEKGELSREKIAAQYSVTTGFTTKTINTLIDNLAKAGRLRIEGDKILPVEKED